MNGIIMFHYVDNVLSVTNNAKSLGGQMTHNYTYDGLL
jgi:hypothetical protein